MADGEETSIKQLINKIAKNGQIAVGVEEGSVISASPLKVTLTNDAKMVLSSIDLVVPEHLRAYSPTITVDGKKYTIPVRKGLSAGDKVYLLVFNNGKKFYVLDRI